jgi:hypothetical protein
VLKNNGELKDDASPLTESPYDRGWVCTLQASDLAGELTGLRIGKPVVAWYQDEIKRLRKSGEATSGTVGWAELEHEFLQGQPEQVGV